jgi:hypothetical protein
VGDDCQRHMVKRSGVCRPSHHDIVFAVPERLEIAVAGMVLVMSVPCRTLSRTRAAHRSAVSSVSSPSDYGCQQG